MIPDNSKLNRGYLHPFWNGSNGRYLYGVGELPRTLTELAMCQLSATIRRSDVWWTKLEDSSWRHRWEDFGLDTSFDIRSSSGSTKITLSNKQIEYVLDELDGYAALRDSPSNCEVSCFERIWETSSEVDPGLLRSLQDNLESQRDVHQRRTTAIFIVDPYLFPLVYGQTFSFNSSGTLLPTLAPPFSEQNYTLSSAYACIPTSFSVSQNRSPTVSAQSYINDIDPWKDDLYRDVEELLGVSIPLFEHVLTDLHRSNLIWHRIPGTCRYTSWDEPLTPQHSDDEEGWINYQKEMRQWALNRPIQYPNVPKEGYQGGLESRKFKVGLSGRTVEVIVKVTDINLHPNKPTFDGTPWHAEGMRNERVVACAVHCIAMSNVTPTSLSFRMPVRAPVGCPYDDEGATIRTWGLSIGAPSHQFLGSASLRKGHAVAFPNVYQHRFTEVHLEDPTKEGSLTLVTFALVDPEIGGDRGDEMGGEVLSTSRIPPQRMSWIRRAMEESLDVRIPTEVVDRIMYHTEGLMTDDDAQNIAEEMRLARIRFWKQHNELWFSLPFNGLDI